VVSTVELQTQAKFKSSAERIVCFKIGDYHIWNRR